MIDSKVDRPLPLHLTPETLELAEELFGLYTPNQVRLLIAHTRAAHEVARRIGTGELRATFVRHGLKVLPRYIGPWPAEEWAP